MAQEPQTTRCSQCGKSFPTTVKLCPDDGTVLEHQPATSSQLGKVLDGKYRLDAFLSQGGMGGVYRATHVMLNKDVAVKLINPELVTSPEIVRRFQREARAATALSHPNIVAVYDLGQTAEGTLYIAMEYVDGPSLRSLIERGGPLPLARTLTIARQLTSALSLAHRRGIIHRDLKPHNVMLARTEDGQQIAKLVDFGIAKTFEEGTQLTVAGFTPGTPQYMSPEQAEGRVVDARSDLYSLGIVIYEMLTGQVPFNAPSLSSLLIKHIKDIPEPPSLKNPNVSIPPDLEAITLRCLAKSPDDRFQTADELGTALDRVAAAMDTAVASMQATVPMAGQQAPGGAAWNAATIPAARFCGHRSRAANTRSGAHRQGSTGGSVAALGRHTSDGRSAAGCSRGYASAAKEDWRACGLRRGLRRGSNRCRVHQLLQRACADGACGDANGREQAFARRASRVASDGAAAFGVAIDTRRARRGIDGRRVCGGQSNRGGVESARFFGGESAAFSSSAWCGCSGGAAGGKRVGERFCARGDGSWCGRRRRACGLDHCAGRWRGGPERRRCRPGAASRVPRESDGLL